ncbi:MAG: sodium-dependent transporter [Bacteroidota bacterium]|nr:sodium-dependent transporter [Bacteroidota bacterium]
MGQPNLSNRDHFTSKAGAIAAAAGSAIGLGNIWRFPYITGQNGGAAFILIYLVFVIFIAIPVLLSEFTIGRKAQRNAFGAFKLLKPNQPWYLIGVMGILGAYMILSFYSTVAGWTLEYLYSSITNSFSGKTPDILTSEFDIFVSSGWRPIIWQIVFMTLTAGIVIMGIKKGIEKFSKILMPILVLLIVALAIRSVTLPGSAAGLRFLFDPDFSKITSNVIIQALGQGFFSLSIGMGVLITYGSYIQKSDNLGNSAVIVALLNSSFSILAGIAIFPAVFAFNIEPASGPGLVFITLPNIFNQMPMGYFFSLLFFALLTIAALTSSISVLEVVVAYATEQLGWTRKKATIIGAVSITATGILCTMSQGPWSELQLFGKNIFDILDYTSANILLPLGGFFIVIFLGWVIGPASAKAEITNNGTTRSIFFGLYIFIIRYIAPIAIAAVFLNGLGVFG